MDSETERRRTPDAGRRTPEMGRGKVTLATQQLAIMHVLRDRAEAMVADVREALEVRQSQVHTSMATMPEVLTVSGLRPVAFDAESDYLSRLLVPICSRPEPAS